MRLPSEIFKNENGNAFFQYFSSISAILSIISSGIHYGWPSPSLPRLQKSNELNLEIPVTADEGFWLATMPLFGAFLGSFSAALLLNKIGRRRTVLLTSFPYLVSGIMITFATNVPTLYVARFIAGISDGWAFSSVPMYIGEIADPKIRGLLASGMSIAFIVGILIINVIGSYLTIKLTALVICIFPIGLLCTFIWMPESPYYLIMKNRQEEAQRSLQTFRGPKVAATELARIDQAIKEDQNQTRSSNPLDLFRVKRNFKAVTVMMLTRGAQQLSGISAIIFYAQNIFIEAGTNISAEVASIIFFSIQVASTFVAGGLIDKLGRRPLLLISAIGSSLALLIEGFYFYLKVTGTVDISNLALIPLIALIAYIIVFSLGLHNIPILMLSEIFNPDIKAVALCFADIYFAAMATAMSKFYQVTGDAYGLYVPFICFAVFAGIASVLIYFIVPETKGKTLEEIQEYFKGTEVKKEKEIPENPAV